MIFKYSKIKMFLYYLSFIPFLAFILTILIIPTGKPQLFIRCIIPGIMMYFTFVILDYKYKGNRSIAFFDNYVHFNFISVKYQSKPITLNVKYEDIYNIEAKRFPIVGIRVIEIKANNFGQKILASFCFQKYADVYATICQKAKNANPDVNIDDKLIEFLKRKNKL